MSRILIVEDEPSIVTSLEFLLREAGHDTRTAGTGTEALALAPAFAPDLVLLDIMIPEIDGFEVCRRLRARPETASLKILMLTARGRQREIERGLAAGADAYMTKPFGTRELLDRVASLIGEQPR